MTLSLTASRNAANAPGASSPADRRNPSPKAMARRLDALFASIGQGFNAYLERRSRQDQIDALNALTDEQLLARGLTRDRIPYHVFRDLMY